MLDVYTLNYDELFDTVMKDAIDGFVEYPKEDGFDCCKYFDPAIAIKRNDDKDLFNHIHGSVRFYTYGPGDDDHCPIHFFTERVGRGTTIKQQILTQDDHLLLFSPMIVGHEKLESGIHDPFRTYRTNLDISLKQNDTLMVVGYGYGDFYINAIIASFLQKGGKLINITPSGKSGFLKRILEGKPELRDNIKIIKSNMLDVILGNHDEELFPM